MNEFQRRMDECAKNSLFGLGFPQTINFLELVFQGACSIGFEGGIGEAHNVFEKFQIQNFKFQIKDKFQMSNPKPL